MISIHQHIAVKIDRRPGGSLLFPTDFRGLGSEDAIKMSLSRHAKNGKLIRLGHGVYLKPVSKGRAKLPSIEKIAATIAKKECIRIKPDGAFALYKLGLSTATPKEFVYVTDGQPRNIFLYNKRLIFKATTPKKLSLSSGFSGMLIQALEEVGKEKVTEYQKDIITTLLKQEKKEVLMKDLQKAPAWIYDLLFKLNQQITK